MVVVVAMSDVVVVAAATAPVVLAVVVVIHPHFRNPYPRALTLALALSHRDAPCWRAILHIPVLVRPRDRVSPVSEYHTPVHRDEGHHHVEAPCGAYGQG